VAEVRPAPAAAAQTFTPHPQRGPVLGEVHARPFYPVPTPSRILRFAFTTDWEQSKKDRGALTAFCQSRGVQGPAEGLKHLRVTLSDAVLRWEQHSEFTTYTFEIGGTDRTPFERPAGQLAQVMRDIPQPGPLLSAIDLHLVDTMPDGGLEGVFDAMSLAASTIDGGIATAASDFKVTSDGFVRFLIINQNLTPDTAGRLTQRLLEIETYRVFALLGLPTAQAVTPALRKAEEELTDIARAMTEATGFDGNHAQLERLMQLASSLELESSRTDYRFSAVRAYEGIIDQRVESLRETPLPLGYPTFATFLARRVKPALRTCHMVAERQSRLAEKIARNANLLRTRVQVDLEQQNRDSMQSMNERARLQLRMQQTVEGLSVAAVSYYVLGLLGYLFKGAKDAELTKLDSSVLTALALPFVIFGVAMAVRRIRKQHSEHDHG